MAEECADDDDDKATITALRKAIHRELNLHSSVLQVLLLPNSQPHSLPHAQLISSPLIWIYLSLSEALPAPST